MYTWCVLEERLDRERAHPGRGDGGESDSGLRRHLDDGGIFHTGYLGRKVLMEVANKEISRHRRTLSHRK